MRITYRQATAADIAAIYNVEIKCFSHPWSYVSLKGDVCDNPISLYLVAEANGSLVGYCGIHTVLDEGHILNVAVLPAYRRRGIGEGLLSTLFGCTGLPYFTLEVRITNYAAVSLYKRLGFKIIGRRPKYYGDEDALIMWKGKNAP